VFIVWVRILTYISDTVVEVDIFNRSANENVLRYQDGRAEI